MSKRTYKVVFLGNAGVGKSQMFVCAARESPSCTERYISPIRATVGTDIIYYSRELDRSTELKLVDTAGDENYTNFCGYMCKGAHFFVLSYAVNCRRSFDDIKERWIPFLRDFSEYSIVVLVETKCDIQEVRVSRSEGEMLALELGVRLYSTSSKNPSTVHVFLYALLGLIDEGRVSLPVDDGVSLSITKERNTCKC